jgi:lipopolysaccharide/colanic/teichoic acid biosynthesis glycosyltransferase
MYKFACEPGITGLAQISGCGLLSWGEVLARDLRYVRTRSVGQELKLIWTTLKDPLFDAAHSDALRSPVARR